MSQSLSAQRPLVRSASLRVAEIYPSVQGEGEFTGIPSVFVRTTGCNLRCWFCDTPYTSWQPEGQSLSIRDIVRTIGRFETGHVVITGGEPLLPASIVELTQRLRQNRHFVTIETAGTIYRDVRADLMSISPKLSNSTPTDPQHRAWARRHDALRDRSEVIEKLVAASRYQFKFVIDRAADIDEVLDYLDSRPFIDRNRVWLMPQATQRAELAEKTSWLRPLAEEHGFQFSSRLHIELHGNTRGT